MSGTIIIPSAERWLILPSNKGSAGAAGPPGSGSTIAVQDEGSALGAATVTTLNITGPGATATRSGAVVTIDVEGGGFGVIDLGDPAHGIVADDSTVNLASTIETLVAAVPGSNGVHIIGWPGVARFDRAPRLNRTIKFSAHGMGGYNGSTPLGGTVLKVPTGSTGLRFLHGTPNAGYSQIDSLSIAQYGAALPDGVGSYNTASPNTITVSSGAANFADHQIVWLEGAGPAMTVLEKTAAITAGTNTVTITTTAPIFIGNPGVYIGQWIDIAGAGLPAGTYVTGWTTTTITLSANATATVSGAAYTVKYPIVAEIQSGGGTGTLTIDTPAPCSAAGAPNNVTGAVLRHAPAALYSTVKVSCRDTFFGFGTQGLGVLLRGSTTDGSNADSSTFDNCYFDGAKAGVVMEGPDVQVGSYVGCNFAGPEIGVLDMGLLGNHFFACHFAFNVGIAITYYSAPTNLISCYFESGTSWNANGAQSFYNCEGLYPYGGLNGLYFSGGTLYTRNAQVESLISTKSVVVGDPTKAGTALYAQGNIGSNPGGSGVGLQVGSGGSDTYILSYSGPGSGVYVPLHVEATTVKFGTSFGASDLGLMDSGGFKLPSGKGYYVNGVKVVAAQQTGWAAWTGTATRTTFATSTATLQNVAEALKALIDDLRTHGLIGT